MNHYDAKDKDQHFVASTAFGWGKGHSPMEAAEKAIAFSPKPIRKNMTKEQLRIFYSGAVWHVPVALDSNYTIEPMRGPDIEGITKIYDGPLKTIK